MIAYRNLWYITVGFVFAPKLVGCLLLLVV